jgi:hypothetical protein
MLTDVRWRGGTVMFLIGLLPIAAIALYYLLRFDLGPVKAVWYLFLLVTGDQTGWLTTACGAVLLAIIGSVAAILIARIRHGEPEPPRRQGRRAVGPPPQSIFGPGGHAGPGAIGNARSTLGR